jgi:SNF family Na+-dependent transporter
MKHQERMRFSTRLMMVLTPLGLAIGLFEAWHLAGKLVFLMAAQILLLAAAAFAVVRIVRRESAQKKSSGT